MINLATCTIDDPTLVACVNKESPATSLSLAAWSVIWRAYGDGQEAMGRHCLAIQLATGILFDPTTPKRVGLRRWRR